MQREKDDLETMFHRGVKTFIIVKLLYAIYLIILLICLS